MDATSLATGLGLVASVLCAAAAIRASRLMASGLWLAGTSAFLATSLYLLGAPYVAVIELSVGAGLVAVLFVFTITTAGDHTNRAGPGVSRWLAAGLTGLALTLLGVAIFPSVQPTAAIADGSFAQVFWQQRSLDAIGQVVLLFVAALGVLTLIGGASLPDGPHADGTPGSADATPDRPATAADASLRLPTAATERQAESDPERVETHA
jgi:NADH:ubiquinone oxidoreductase subunit 6 (subunit J)